MQLFLKNGLTMKVCNLLVLFNFLFIDSEFSAEIYLCIYYRKKVAVLVKKVIRYIDLPQISTVL